MGIPSPIAQLHVVERRGILLYYFYMTTASFSQQTIARWFFIFLGAGMAYLFFHIIAPFLITILAAAMVAILATPLEKWLRNRVHHPRISTLIVLLSIVILIAGPLATMGIIAVRQALEITQWILANPHWMSQLLTQAHEYLSVFPPFIQKAIPLIDISSVIQTIAEWVRAHGASVFSSGASLVLKAFIFFNAFLGKKT